MNPGANKRTRLLRAWLLSGSGMKKVNRQGKGALASFYQLGDNYRDFKKRILTGSLQDRIGSLLEGDTDLYAGGYENTA